MTRRRPLPDDLVSAAFTSEDLARNGLPRDRVRAHDITVVSRGVYRSAPPAPHGLLLDTGDTAALLRKTGAVLSHRSAAAVHGIPLPPWLESFEGLEVTLPSRKHTTLRPGLTAHRRPLPPSHTVQVGELLTTSAERTWCDLASLLRSGQEGHLVAAGDHLVTPPWTPRGRAAPATTIPELRRALAESRRFKGIRLARAALAQVRVGADSIRETQLRLALVHAGLPEPGLQVSADPEDPFAPEADLGYRRWRIALQYDGHHHRAPEQQARDARRDVWFQSRDWLNIRVTSDDLRDDFRRVIRLVRERAAAFQAGRGAA
jgi:hypothetical protein